MKIQVFGIKNCDSVKKVLRFLDDNSVKYDFVDFKKVPPSKKLVKLGLSQFPETFLNKRGTTYRKLKDRVEKANQSELISLMIENSSLIKRPIIFCDDNPFSIGVDKEKLNQLI